MLRLLPALAVCFFLTILSVRAADVRHGVTVDGKTFPQSTPKETLQSVLDAIKANRFDYLVAQLADPDFIDARIKRVYDGKFDEQVSDTRARLDPATVKQLTRFLKEGKWTIDKTTAVVHLDDVKDRCVRLAKNGEKWFLEHRFDLNAP